MQGKLKPILNPLVDILLLFLALLMFIEFHEETRNNSDGRGELAHFYYLE